MKLTGKQCKAEMLRMIRNPYYVFWSLAMPILFYFIFTRVVSTGIGDKGEWQAHYLMSMTSFSVMGSAIMTLGIRLVQERTRGWGTFMKLTPLPGPVYFFCCAGPWPRCLIWRTIWRWSVRPGTERRRWR